MTKRKPRTDADRLAVEFFEDRDVDIRGRKLSIVTTRKVHRCALGDAQQNYHDIPVGERALRETAIVDNQWGAYYCCVKCIDKYMDEEGM